MIEENIVRVYIDTDKEAETIKNIEGTTLKKVYEDKDNNLAIYEHRTTYPFPSERWNK